MSKKRPKLPRFDQERIYNLRYAAGYNGMGSPVQVLTAERVALASAMRRLQSSRPNISAITMADFGYGVGRVPNDFMSTWVGPADLTIVAYDVSRVGLKRSMKIMSAHLPTVTTYDDADRLVATCSSDRGDSCKRTMHFVHGSPGDKAGVVADVLMSENNGNQFDVTTSWYDAVGHDPRRKRRLKTFGMLGAITRPDGEVAITTSTIGDFNSAYGDEPFNDYPDDDGDRNVIYTTEIGEDNFIHLFGSGFERYMRETRTEVGQHIWYEPIRMLGPEYTDGIQEQIAYGELRQWGNEHRGNSWTQADFASIHSVGGFRSLVAPAGQFTF